MTISKHSVFSLALLALVAMASAKPQFQFQPQYQQVQQQQPQQQFQQPRQQQFQNRFQPQQFGFPEQQTPSQPLRRAEKVAGLETQDVVPKQDSPLKNPGRAQSNPQYVDFINQLYRFDRTKPSLQHRQKRALIFRPLFVYRQQKAQKQKVQAEQSAPSSPVSNQSQHYKDDKNKVYREYNSFYEPYRYGQRYPYRN